jgi:translation elongation factor EF-4
MTLQQKPLSATLQQFRKLWEQMAVINTHIAFINKEIEVVKAHIQELIGIDVSNLATFGDLSNLEDSLKQYTDEAIDSIPQPDLTEVV